MRTAIHRHVLSLRLSLAILPALLLIGRPAGAADVIMDGEKSIGHDYVLENTENFPAWRFIYAPVHLDGWAEIMTGVPFSWYKLRSTTIYAVPGEAALPEGMDAAWLEGMPRSSQAYDVQATAPIGDRISTRRTVLRVVSVTEDEVVLEVVREEVYGDDGGALDSAPRAILVGLGVAAFLLLVCRTVRARAA